MAKKIVLELHQEDNEWYLESNDVFQFITENTEAEVELFNYIDKWCEYLNYYLEHSEENMFGDVDYAKLKGWLDGYTYAKKISVTHHANSVEIKMRKYHIILMRPYKGKE